MLLSFVRGDWASLGACHNLDGRLLLFVVASVPALVVFVVVEAVVWVVRIAAGGDMGWGECRSVDSLPDILPGVIAVAVLGVVVHLEHRLPGDNTLIGPARDDYSWTARHSLTSRAHSDRPGSNSFPPVS